MDFETMIFAVMEKGKKKVTTMNMIKIAGYCAAGDCVKECPYKSIPDIVDCHQRLINDLCERLETAYDEICVDCYTCKFSHWNTGHKCKYKDCERAGNESKWQWRGDEE